MKLGERRYAVAVLAAATVLVSACLLAEGAPIATAVASAGHRTSAVGDRMRPPADSMTPSIRVLPTLSHKGRWLTDPEGRVVILHGVQVAATDTASPQQIASVDLTPQNLAFLRHMGFNLVRTTMTFSGVEPAPGKFDPAYVKQFVSFDDQLAEHGIYDLLDMMQTVYSQLVGGSGFPNWMTVIGSTPNTRTPWPFGYTDNPAEDVAWDNLWRNATTSGGTHIESAYFDGLRRLAGYYRHAPALLGIEVLNEPFPGTGWASCANPVGCPAFDGTELTRFYRGAIKAIHSADPRHLAIYEPNIFFNNGAQTGLGNLGDPNTLFAFHNYCLAYDAEYLGGPNPDPLQLCGVEEKIVLSNALKSAAHSGSALLMDEWGDTPNVTLLDRMTAEADHSMVGWSYWAYEQDPGGSPGTIIADGTKPPAAPGNLNRRVLDALVRPYPQVIAGTPSGWSYDNGSGRFTMSYSVRRVAGGIFGPGAHTTVELPRLNYPHGYAVTVHGATVVSAPNSAKLVLAQYGRGPDVHVTVTRTS